jgi:hypothetical protein
MAKKPEAVSKPELTPAEQVVATRMAAAKTLGTMIAKFQNDITKAGVVRKLQDARDLLVTG